MFSQIFKKVSIVLITTLITSCANMQSDYYTQTVSSWRGSHVNTLQQYWGKPDKKMSTLSGSTIYVYKQQKMLIANTGQNPQVGVSYHPGGAPVVTIKAPHRWGDGVTLFCIVAFEANPQGEIIDVQTQGNNCHADRKFMQTMSNPGYNN